MHNTHWIGNPREVGGLLAFFPDGLYPVCHTSNTVFSVLRLVGVQCLRPPCWRGINVMNIYWNHTIQKLYCESSCSLYSTIKCLKLFMKQTLI